MVSGVFEVTFFCLPVYLPNTDPTFQFLCWKKSQDFSSYKYKAKYSFSHMYIQSPSQFSTFLEFSLLTPNPRKWHTFSTLPPPLLLCEHFPVIEMPFLSLPSSKVYPSFKWQNRFPCFKKTFLSSFYLELFFQYHLKALLNWIETFSHRMVITFGRRKQLYFPVKNSEFKLSRDSFKAYIIILHLGFIFSLKMYLKPVLSFQSFSVKRTDSLSLTNSRSSSVEGTTSFLFHYLVLHTYINWFKLMADQHW